MHFLTDAALGKLGRYLRAAGFDTICAHQFRQSDVWDRVDQKRIILTRTTAIAGRFQEHRMIFIRDDDPWQQLMQVVRDLGIEPGDIKAFSRCILCNRVVHPVDRLVARRRVPAYVWQQHSTFHACGQCRRVYWAGSHHERLTSRLAAIFPIKKEKNHEPKTIKK